MESKALDKSIEMEPMTFLESRARRQTPVVKHFDQSSVARMTAKKARHVRREQGFEYVVQLVKIDFF